MFGRKFPRHILTTLLGTALMLAACNVGAAPVPTTDINAINTAIVGTTVAQLSGQLTQTALAVPPTPLPTNTPQELPTFSLPTAEGGALPTVSFDATPTVEGLASPLPAFTQAASPVPAATQVLGDSCFNAVFEEDVTIPDGTIVKGGETLQKKWKIRNTGTCTWDEGFRLVHIAGSIPKDNIATPYYEFQSKDSVPSGEAIVLSVWLNAPCAAGQYEGHWRMQTDAGGNNYFGTILSIYIETQGKTGGCK